mmetsp:Transcript_20378/g.56780  ORF Transcript_20378/g.56780 Transcript_20378/m.56780 type:complete len:310 (-) Transcript_20378:1196-2125(-)
MAGRRPTSSWISCVTRCRRDSTEIPSCSPPPLKTLSLLWLRECAGLLVLELGVPALERLRNSPHPPPASKPFRPSATLPPRVTSSDDSAYCSSSGGAGIRAAARATAPGADKLSAALGALTAAVSLSSSSLAPSIGLWSTYCTRDSWYRAKQKLRHADWSVSACEISGVTTASTSCSSAAAWAGCPFAAAASALLAVRSASSAAAATAVGNVQHTCFCSSFSSSSMLPDTRWPDTPTVALMLADRPTNSGQLRASLRRQAGTPSASAASTAAGGTNSEFSMTSSLRSADRARSWRAATSSCPPTPSPGE